MEYMTVKEAAKRWNRSESTIRKWCTSGQLLAVVKAQKISGRWQIPVDAECPKPVKKKENVTV